MTAPESNQTDAQRAARTDLYDAISKADYALWVMLEQSTLQHGDKHSNVTLARDALNALRAATKQSAALASSAPAVAAVGQQPSLSEAKESLEDLIDLIEVGMVKLNGAKLYPAGQQRVDDARAVVAALSSPAPAAGADKPSSVDLAVSSGQVPDGVHSGQGGQNAQLAGGTDQ